MRVMLELVDAMMLGFVGTGSPTCANSKATRTLSYSIMNTTTIIQSTYLV